MKTERKEMAVMQPRKQVKPVKRNDFANTLDFFLDILRKEQGIHVEQTFDDSLWRLDDDGNYPEVL
ncbi:MAG: hypothetical protein E7Z67_06200 [Thermoplasmata archaeon]|nr:hypothetical protein [Thermoplasmata archaeon]